MTDGDALRVLIVDDDPEQLAMVARGLRLESFEVEVASESLGVSNLARRFRPDVVLLDVNIPALSGDRLLSVLRENMRLHRPRLVLFSACDREELRRLARDVEADGWIPKGVTGRELADQLRDLCARGT